VEVDETYVGGHGDKTHRLTMLTPVVALVERGGRARVKVIASVTQRNLGHVLNECVSKDATVNTDEQGRFRINGLPPLERYLAVATDYLEDGEHYDPEFLERMRSNAVEFSLGDVESRAVELKVVER